MLGAYSSSSQEELAFLFNLLAKGGFFRDLSRMTYVQSLQNARHASSALQSSKISPLDMPPAALPISLQQQSAEVVSLVTQHHLSLQIPQRKTPQTPALLYILCIPRLWTRSAIFLLSGKEVLSLCFVCCISLNQIL